MHDLYEHRNVRQTIILLCFLGVGIASYLAYAYITHTPVRCTAGIFGGCGEVQESEYASFLGIPIPVFGLMFYVFLFADALFLLGLHRTWYAWRSFVWFVTLTGFLFSLYLAFLEAFVIEAWCVWCVGSGLVSTAIFVVASRAFFRRR